MKKISLTILIFLCFINAQNFASQENKAQSGISYIDYLLSEAQQSLNKETENLELNITTDKLFFKLLHEHSFLIENETLIYLKDKNIYHVKFQFKHKQKTIQITTSLYEINSDNEIMPIGIENTTEDQDKLRVLGYFYLWHLLRYPIYENGTKISLNKSVEKIEINYVDLNNRSKTLLLYTLTIDSFRKKLAKSSLMLSI